MGKIPVALRETIARNIKTCRLAKFPGRGGVKACAKAFGVSPQQWSPWEKGRRTPDELRLTEIADFFGMTVEWMRADHRSPSQPPPETASLHCPNSIARLGRPDWDGSFSSLFGALAGLQVDGLMTVPFLFVSEFIQLRRSHMRGISVRKLNNADDWYQG